VCVCVWQVRVRVRVGVDSGGGAATNACYCKPPGSALAVQFTQRSANSPPVPPVPRDQKGFPKQPHQEKQQSTGCRWGRKGATTAQQHSHSVSLTLTQPEPLTVTSKCLHRAPTDESSVHLTQHWVCQAEPLHPTLLPVCRVLLLADKPARTAQHVTQYPNMSRPCMPSKIAVKTGPEGAEACDEATGTQAHRDTDHDRCRCCTFPQPGQLRIRRGPWCGWGVGVGLVWVRAVSLDADACCDCVRLSIRHPVGMVAEVAGPALGPVAPRLRPRPGSLRTRGPTRTTMRPWRAVEGMRWVLSLGFSPSSPRSCWGWRCKPPFH
jgi:hypothetical protein